ncbi:putative nucleolar complex protein 14 [Zancudomyces culisetae]|uniref:Putative nucleolar complex protein 14 n=1 Tax=Zancudomyces culisetae TaxID=1213189 RepID=A0A1R1PYL0_ZANCU|nr:putative nucleolar complex protein 14 [Zancudomyces culisetae]|eukprot:OMH86050.1 putative nucleolar complex protein 14 [Zancudomyces culisetae]
MGAKGNSGKQSALKKLKAQLNEAGKLGSGGKNKVTKKERQRQKKNGLFGSGGSGATGSTLPKQLANKLKRLQVEITNPFDIKANPSKKFEVVGQGSGNNKGVTGKRIRSQYGLPGVSRQLGLEKREKTLVSELESKHKVGGIRDRRFGENNEKLSFEEKMLQRYTAERQAVSKRKRKNDKFNLSDGEDSEGEGNSGYEDEYGGSMGFELTHGGKRLTELDDYEMMGNYEDLSSDDARGENSNIDAETVTHDHFGGFKVVNSGSNREGDNGYGYGHGHGHGHGENEGEEKVKKSKAQIMKEVIAKSKLHKYERQLTKQNDLDIIEELDDEYQDIKQLLSVAIKESNEKQKESNDGRGSMFGAKQQPTQVDAYDSNVKQLGFDNSKRANPQDRLKTEEELAVERKEKLERNERHRIRRMQGLDSDTESGSDSEGGDDDDDEDDEYNKNVISFGKGLSSRNGKNGQEENYFSDEEGIVKITKKNTAFSITNNINKNNNSGGSGSGSASASASGSKDQVNELPFVFPAPKTYKEFVELTTTYSTQSHESNKDGDDDDENENGEEKPITVTIIERLLMLYNTKVSPQNKSIAEKLFCILFEYLKAYVNNNNRNAVTAPSVDKRVVDALFKSICQLVNMVPEHCCEYIRQYLKHLLALETTTAGSPSSTLLTFGDIFALKLVLMVYSSSDKHHYIVTPTVLILCRTLSLGSDAYTTRNYSVIFKHLLIMSILHDSIRLSARYIPEVIKRLDSLLQFILDLESESDADSNSNSNSNSNSSSGSKDRILVINNDADGGFARINFSVLQSLPLFSQRRPQKNSEKPSNAGELNGYIVTSTLTLLQRFTRLYNNAPFASQNPSFHEYILTPMSAKLGSILSLLPQLMKTNKKSKSKSKESSNSTSIVKDLSLLVNSLISQINPSSSTFSPQHNYQFLKLQAHKPLAIRSIAPKFSYSSSFYLDSRNNNSASALKRQYKEQLRGAVKELRKDSAFLNKLNLDKQLDADAQYKKTMNKAFNTVDTDIANTRYDKKDDQ